MSAPDGVRTLDLHAFAGRPSAAVEGVDWLPVRNELDVRAFGINAYRAPRAGAEIVEPHDEADEHGHGHQEAYVVVTGHALFTVDGQEIDAPAGTIVFVADPRLHRRAVAVADGTLVLGVGAQEGLAYSVSEWEGRWLRKTV